MKEDIKRQLSRLAVIKTMANGDPEMGQDGDAATVLHTIYEMAYAEEKRLIKSYGEGN